MVSLVPRVEAFLVPLFTASVDKFSEKRAEIRVALKLIKKMETFIFGLNAELLSFFFLQKLFGLCDLIVYLRVA